MSHDQTKLEYYAHHSFFTNPGKHSALFSNLPNDIAELCEIVQGIIIHQYWAPAYGYHIPESKAAEYRIRTVQKKLSRLIELHPGPITQRREPPDRIGGNCRDFALVLTAILRSQGRPARMRCGFATYFSPPGKEWYEDHFICEVWDRDQNSWGIVDPQLDAKQQNVLGISFDPCSIPQEYFLPGGEAWLKAFNNKVDPRCFGYGETIGGLPNIRGNLIRDLALLNKVEILGWDCWGLIEGDDTSMDQDDLELLNKAAALSLDFEKHDKMVELYQKEMRLRVPPLLKRNQEDSGFCIEDILEGQPSLARYL
jgi:hypothetical protein